MVPDLITKDISIVDSSNCFQRVITGVINIQLLFVQSYVQYRIIGYMALSIYFHGRTHERYPLGVTRQWIKDDQSFIILIVVLCALLQ